MIGKSIYIWQVQACFNGDPNTIADALALAGFQSAILHDAHLANWCSTERIALVQALKEHGIIPIGGAAVYGISSVWEGEEAARICNECNLPAFVFDAEATFDAQAKSDSNAVKLLQAFKRKTTAKAGWCWWAMYHPPGKPNSTWHPKAVLWAAMAQNYGDADFGVPMAYWSNESASAAVTYLNECWSQWREITNKPLCPAGRAYNGDGGTARPEAITAFEQRCRELGASGITWWSLQQAFRLSGIWQALTNLTPLDTEYLPQPSLPEISPELMEPDILGQVIVNGLRVRSGPGINYPIIGALFQGECITVHEERLIESWVKHDVGWSARYSDGKEFIRITNG